MPGIRARKQAEKTSISIAKSTTGSEITPPSEAGLQQQSNFSNEMLQTRPEQSVIDWSADLDFPSSNELLDLPGSAGVHAGLPHKDNMMVVECRTCNESGVSWPGLCEILFFCDRQFLKIAQSCPKPKGGFLQAITDSNVAFLVALYLFLRIEESR